MREILDRFIDWVNKHGGPTPVAVTIGKSPQSFYNYTNRGSKPNMEIFALLANHYSDFDPGFILTGKQQNDASEEIERLKAELERERSIVNRFVAKVKGATFRPSIDGNVRKHQHADAIYSVRRKRTFKLILGRVPGDILSQLSA